MGIYFIKNNPHFFGSALVRVRSEIMKLDIGSRNSTMAKS